VIETGAGMTPAVLAQRFVDAFNAREEHALQRLYHPDARVKRPTWPSEGDVAASLASIRLDFGAYPDGQLKVRQTVVHDRVAVVEFSSRGSTPGRSPCSTASRCRPPAARSASAARSCSNSTRRA
jgi:hypothetical protein